MNADWWPSLLRFIPQEDLWAATKVPVSRLRTIQTADHHPGEYRSYSALVPIADLDAVAAYPRGLAHEVSASGPGPYAGVAPHYDPLFWIHAQGLPKDRYEPLILAWTTNNRTVLMPDPRFLMTYGLTPRQLKDGKVSFDAPATPTFDIVEVDPPSIWDFPYRTTSGVRIERDYLQDYLSLRGTALFEVFYATATGDVDEESLALLAGEDAKIITFHDREIQLNHSVDDGRANITAQVWGARLLAGPADMPITRDPIEQTGLVWPGYDGSITPQEARRFRVGDHVYVDDAVLAPYEGRPDFTVYPESGGVSFGGQWAVSFCDRIGRNTIRLEIRKMYEGVPPPVIRHWNKHAFLPDAAFLLTAPAEQNIGERAKQLVGLWASAGRYLQGISETLGEASTAADFVKLDKKELEYRGWWSPATVEPNTRHVPLGLSRDAFLQRCVHLNILLSESLGKVALRRVLEKLGVPAAETKALGSLKLLNELVCLLQVSLANGYDISSDAELIRAELKANGTEPDRPLESLFALYDLRIVGAHASGDVAQETAEILERFGVEPGEFANGYGLVLDRVYDAVIADLTRVNKVLASAA